MGRSVNAEINLEPGRYHVLMKLIAFRHDDEPTEEIVRRVASTRREKLVQVGLSYDLAHAKGLVVQTEQEKREQDQFNTIKTKKRNEEIKKKMQKDWIRSQKIAARQERQENIAAMRATRTPNGSSFDRNPEHSPIPNQIISDGPFNQSPTDVASIASDSSDRRVPCANGSVPTIHVNGSKGLHERHASRTGRRRNESPRPSLDSRISGDMLDPIDLELLEGFEFDSDLDVPSEDADAKCHPPMMGQDEPAVDPWNAVCVVGLRVYSMDPMLSLQVVHPVPEDDTEAPLDRDDPAASATTLQRDSYSWKDSWSSQLPF
jgi:hypothetical protein